MANPEHLAKLREGPEAWNRWREEHADVVPDLSNTHLFQPNLFGADLGRANLTQAMLFGANLGRANLGAADLTKASLFGARLGRADLRATKLFGADLGQADLTLANLAGADLAQANLTLANLVEANLVGADLRFATLIGAILHGADFHEAVLSETFFCDTNLSGVKGLETCKHDGPSTVDHRTLAKSGPLPLAFLRGCGLPDVFIDYLPSLLKQPIQFHSCFISYSTKDQEFADRLHADLQNKGVRCWFAPDKIKGGEKVHEQIDRAIQVHDRLLLILSKHSMKSEWVKTEIAKARKREVREKRRMLFPVGLVDFEALRDWECFDADTGKDSAREIREYFVPDFSQWKDHDSYQEQFERLLRDLKAETGRDAAMIEGLG